MSTIGYIPTMFSATNLVWVEGSLFCNATGALFAETDPRGLRDLEPACGPVRNQSSYSDSMATAAEDDRSQQ
jgi:hypothetical protein